MRMFEGFADGALVRPHVVNGARRADQRLERDEQTRAMVEPADLPVGAAGWNVVDFPAPTKNETFGWKVRELDCETGSGILGARLQNGVGAFFADRVLRFFGEFDFLPGGAQAVFKIFSEEDS